MGWILSADYVGSHTLRNVRPLDVDPPTPFIRTAQGQSRTAQAANCTRPYWVEWYQQEGMTCNPNAASNPQPPYSVIQSDVNDGYAYYDALDVNLNHRFNNGLAMLASYTWSHAIDNVDPDVPSQNPNDPNFTGAAENGNAIFDQRHRFVLSGSYPTFFKINAGGVVTLASGLPYNYVTGSTNSGDLGRDDRPAGDRWSGGWPEYGPRRRDLRSRSFSGTRICDHGRQSIPNEAARGSIQRSEPCKLCGLQRHVWQWGHGRHGFRAAADRSDQPVDGDGRCNFQRNLCFRDRALSRRRSPDRVERNPVPDGKCAGHQA